MPSRVPVDISTIQKLEELENDYNQGDLTSKGYCRKMWDLLKPFAKPSQVKEVEKLQCLLQVDMKEDHYFQKMIEVIQKVKESESKLLGGGRDSCYWDTEEDPPTNDTNGNSASNHNENGNGIQLTPANGNNKQNGSSHSENNSPQQRNESTVEPPKETNKRISTYSGSDSEEDKPLSTFLSNGQRRKIGSVKELASPGSAGPSNKTPKISKKSLSASKGKKKSEPRSVMEDNIVHDVEDLSDNDPPEIATTSKESSLPFKSCTKYLKAYDNFKNWRRTKKIKKVSEDVVLAYLTELSQTKVGITLWAIYSMLKATLILKDNIDIKPYSQVTSFLKRKSLGHKPKKSKVLSKNDIERFLLEAEDSDFLLTKVALILGVCGACRCDELAHLLTEHIIINKDLIIVNIIEPKTKKSRTFTIVNPPDAQINYLFLIKKYIQLRPKGITHGRFFILYKNGKCTRQPVGVHKLAEISKTVATFLNLSEPEKYTGHCLRRTSATILADSGVSMTTLKRHGGWKSVSVAEEYLEDSLTNKNEIAKTILATQNDQQPSTSSAEVSNVITYNQEESFTTEVTANNHQNYEVFTEEIPCIVQINDGVLNEGMILQVPSIDVSNNSHCSIIIYPKK